MNNKRDNENKAVAIRVLWQDAPEQFSFDVINGRLQKGEICVGTGKQEKADFFFQPGAGGVLLTLDQVRIDYGSEPTLLSVRCGARSFSFFLRDALSAAHPVFLPVFQVLAVPGEESRSYDEIVDELHARNLCSDFQRFEMEPEESWEAAAARNRKQYCPTWLGLARDMRIFRVAHQEKFGYWGEIVPTYLAFPDHLRNEKGEARTLQFVVGPGASCRVAITRSLEDGALPILHSLQQEAGMDYRLTLFATLEKTPLSADRVQGTDYQICYAYSGGNMLKQEEKDALAKQLKQDLARQNEEVVCRCRIEVINTGKTPRYAWIKTPFRRDGGALFDSETGFLRDRQNQVLCATLLNGVPVHDAELALLIQPDAPVVLDFIIPHDAISPERAEKLRQQNFAAHLAGAKAYWRKKLERAAQFSIPDPPIQKAVQAGLLHCDLAAIGQEPDQPLAATIGWYSPIGTESSPIIQFFDSMGWHDIAERAIEFFLVRQHDNGFIQSFSGYQSETGPLLWTMGEHFRYTRNTDWLKRVKPHIDKACDYLLAWRERNKTEANQAAGCYGLVDGKVADPEDFYHQFFLNAGTWAGLERSAELYEIVDPPRAAALKSEVAAYKEDLRAAFRRAMAEAPVVPVGNGDWAPFPPPWTDALEATALYRRKGPWFTHGSFSAKESLVGALWLVYYGIFEPDEIETTLLLQANQSPVTVENACLSQPYYCRHDFAHLCRGEVKAFLKTYYNQLTGLADQETRTFWEHFYGASQHKTHEEGWFLMQTRWMLYREVGETLELFSAVPRAWLAPGKSVRIDGAVSYFGPVQAQAQCSADGKRVTCMIEIPPEHGPKQLRVRLPRFDQVQPKSVNGGEYCAETEIVTVPNFNAQVTLQLSY